MRLQLYDTILIDDFTYIDIGNLNGVTYTWLMVKKEEPNIFECVLTQEGNTKDTILENWKNNVSKNHMSD